MVAGANSTAAGPLHTTQPRPRPWGPPRPRPRPPAPIEGTFTGISGWSGKGLRVGGVSWPTAGCLGLLRGVGKPSSFTAAASVSVSGRMIVDEVSTVIVGGLFLSDSAVRFLPP